MATDLQEKPVVLIAPTAKVDPQHATLARRLPSLAGSGITVVNALNDPDRSNGEIILERISEILLTAGATNVTTPRTRPSAQDMEAGLLDRIASSSNGVVIIEGD